jgi:glucose/arabinose dehydrogenase
MRASALRLSACLILGACSETPRGAADARPAVIDAAVGPVAPSCDPVLGEPELDLELVAEGFDKPVHVSAPPGDRRLFVLEQHTGRVKIIADGAVRARPFLEVGGQLARAYEQGLLSLAFHPDYAANGRFFLTFTRTDNAMMLEEWRVSDDPDRANEGSRRTILEIPQPTNIHIGGRVEFGPDGYLYLGHGDGGPQFDPEGRAQDLGSLLGKFLRIDVDAEAAGLRYAIPADNPFVGVAGARPEIIAYGVRNPWGWSIDPATGYLYFGDVGLARWEEISVLADATAGANFGWPILMGNECVESGCDSTGLTAPLHVYSYINQQRCAVVGGQVYRGCRMPGHHGRFFFSDFCAGFVHSLRWSALTPASTEIVEHTSLVDRLPYVSGFGRDAAGELLILDWEGGKVHRIVPAP